MSHKAAAFVQDRLLDFEGTENVSIFPGQLYLEWP